MNLAMAYNFQRQDFSRLRWPVSMYIDYIRIYQRRGTKDGLTCDPPQRPTKDYIDRLVHFVRLLHHKLTIAQAYECLYKPQYHDMG